MYKFFLSKYSREREGGQAFGIENLDVLGLDVFKGVDNDLGKFFGIHAVRKKRLRVMGHCRLPYSPCIRMYCATPMGSHPSRRFMAVGNG